MSPLVQPLQNSESSSSIGYLPLSGDDKSRPPVSNGAVLKTSLEEAGHQEPKGIASLLGRAFMAFSAAALIAGGIVLIMIGAVTSEFGVGFLIGGVGVGLILGGLTLASFCYEESKEMPVVNQSSAQAASLTIEEKAKKQLHGAFPNLDLTDEMIKANIDSNGFFVDLAKAEPAEAEKSLILVSSYIQEIDKLNIEEEDKKTRKTIAYALLVEARDVKALDDFFTKINGLDRFMELIENRVGMAFVSLVRGKSPAQADILDSLIEEIDKNLARDEMSKQ